MKKSSSKKVALTVKLAEGKAVKARVNLGQYGHHRLDNMNDAELRRELDTLPRKIAEATALRDKLYGRLRERWSTAYANDQEFVTAYARAEAAGQEVVYLLDRAAKAGRIWYQRTSGKLV